MPELNPFDEPLQRARQTISSLTERKNTVSAELKWFNSTSEATLSTTLKEANAQANVLRNKHAEIDGAIKACHRKQAETTAQVRTILNPKNWFASDQVQLRRAQKELGIKITAHEVEQKEISARIQAADIASKKAAAELTRFCEFDVQKKKEELGNIETLLAQALPKVESLMTQKSVVDQALEPVVEQMRQYSQTYKSYEQRRNRAASLESELDSASNGYERALVHEQCETEFNVGSPKKVIVESEKEMRRIQRDYDKALKRAEEIGQKAARRIDAIVIDGNNLCYENGKFIGLAALVAIVPILQSEYSVTVIFDAAIRRMLNADDARIARQFGVQVRVHVVATHAKADETILDVAASSKYAYILSNDRYGEYNDKAPIRERRIIRHEIVNGKIFIHDLGIDEAFDSLETTQ